MAELHQDFVKTGQTHPTSHETVVLIRDHHGNKTTILKSRLREWPVDKILADPDPSEGRPFKSGDCVRLMTDEYWGMPQGIEGYVSGVISNKFLGWEGNFCQVIFIVACKYETTKQDKITVWDDFLEVQDDQLQLCDENHPPSLCFPYQVSRNGQVIRDPKSGSFERHPKITPYTFDDLCKALNKQPGGSLQQEGEENPTPSPGVERLSFQTREAKVWNSIKSLWKKVKKGVRNDNQNISKKLKQIIG